MPFINEQQIAESVVGKTIRSVTFKMEYPKREVGNQGEILCITFEFVGGYQLVIDGCGTEICWLDIYTP